MNPAEHVEAQLRELGELAGRTADTMSNRIAEIAELVIESLEAGCKLMFCGNGGSAADAQHLATEYVVRFRRNREPFGAIALTTDTSLLTAAANDFGFDQIFERQVRALGIAGDILFLHSTSGESQNLLLAAEAAEELGILTVALLGRDGGHLKDRVDHALVINTANGAHAQELHLAIGHVICDLVETRFAGEVKARY